MFEFSNSWGFKLVVRLAFLFTIFTNMYLLSQHVCNPPELTRESANVWVGAVQDCYAIECASCLAKLSGKQMQGSSDSASAAGSKVEVFLHCSAKHVPTLASEGKLSFVQRKGVMVV